ncbi:MAG: 1,4-dihydroxy-2-naphthoate octaprenyltransferase [Candidatus Marinimicrobia bacterium]|jgi:1,4-dihydroxy-2-naphthoate octaprenyltransferase|nr:1,4-dihydroxy-2-naphthoate octaprenyltransferase [Candidatus Neomarinimicrobiota bacterium]MBT4593485.1 1,4-dihydroxy-2-naphthoate octaprenyltransferase [Candidatus Neomarinimicrobiota bacterium]MBT4991546.1 1,4-dihydroxy-2-naphthoate octaprenyltransferase [Candidatus Neomarinimicrobiota bacterium]
MNWINAFRLRTLPLAFSCIIMGSGLAMADGQFNLTVFTLALVTTLFLQILSNLANDYGDFVKGTDNEDRVGPDRTMQSGLITKHEMINAMWIIAFLCSVFGVWLIYEGTLGLDLKKAGLFAILGLTAMGAAVKYTMGKNPYGYAGLGDIFVFLFFGWLGVLGSYFLHTHSFQWNLLLPASTIGLFTTAVLNINNMRDHEPDAQSGKNTLVVRIGIIKAKAYHQSLIYGGLLLSLAFIIPSTYYIHYLFMVTAPLFIGFVQSINRRSDFQNFDPFLKKQAITTFVFSILFVIGINL